MSSRACQSLQLRNKLELTDVYPFFSQNIFEKEATCKALPVDTEKIVRRV